MDSFNSFLFFVQVSTLGYKTNHSLSKGAKKERRKKSLVGNDNKQKQKPNEEIDPFSRFIFGNHKQRETYTESENDSQELPEQNEQSSFDNRSNRTDDWFFGSRRKEPTQSAPTIQNQIEDYINNVDIELLMETFDTIVTTSKQFKPLMKEITPFFHRFSKKFKSN